MALKVHGLRVETPDGRLLIEDLTMEVRPGEVAVLLGGSGSGKSTFSRVLFEPETLAQDGFRVQLGELALDRSRLGLVPQRGALFDHLDVHGNLDLALRYGGQQGDPADWLERVGLERDLARRPVGALSGGQAQRVAVARVLAGGRELLFLDEPSVGLDPQRVRVLARLIRDQCQGTGVAAIVVTHDVSLAVGVADQLYVLDASSRRLEQLFSEDWPGPMERPEASAEQRGHWLIRLEAELVDRIERAQPVASQGGEVARGAVWRWCRQRLGQAAAPFGVAATAVVQAPAQLVLRPRDFARVGMRVARQTVLRPLAFYGIVSALIGYTVLYVISRVGGAGVRPDALIREIGGSYVVALAPALSAILFVAASGSATNAWLGNMSLTRQSLAMRALGVDTRRYLWSPTWVVCGAGYLVVAALFTLGMVVGGVALCHQQGVAGGWELLTAEFVDPRPERVRYVLRAAFLVWIYGWGIASDVVAKGTPRKDESDDVTRAMTGSVVACTLWVVAWELASVLVVL